MANKKTLIPNDPRDFMTLFSIFGFLGIALSFGFDINFINDNLNAIFLGLAGILFIILGYGIKIKDGLQRGEFTRALSLVIGIASIIISLFLYSENLSTRYDGVVAIISAVPLTYLVIDYYIKNTRKK